MRTAEFEDNAALARLARNNVLGLRDLETGNQDVKEAAFRRFLKRCPAHLSHEQARRFFETRMLGVLKEGRLTVNFNAGQLFANGREPEQMLNKFDLSTVPSHNPKTVKDLWYRNDVEMEFIDYAGRARGVARKSRQANNARRLVSHYGATGIGRTGLPTSRTFESSVRPKYGALDFAYCRGGGAGGNGYGQSFLILKEHVKHASTYLHTDSFKVNKDLAARKHEYGGRIVSLREATATYFELEKILLYCTPSMFAQIHAYASGQRARGSRFCLPPDTTGVKVNYIEFQAHTDIRFDRDVAAMAVSRAELERSLFGLVPWHRMERHIREFATERKIRLSFFA